MASTPEPNAPSNPPSDSTRPANPPADEPPTARRRKRQVHEVAFTTYPKLLFVWPLILLGYIFWPFAAPVPDRVGSADPAGGASRPPAVTTADVASTAPATAPAATSFAAEAPPHTPRAGYAAHLEVLGWVYLAVMVLVILTLGIDVDRNAAIFLVILIAGLYFLGMWLRDVQHFTLFGDIYAWFANLDLQYDRALGLALSAILSVPYVLMLARARLDSRWRITHNEFEHYSFGRSDDSLGRGAKTIRTSFPDVFELLLGLAGTMIVYNATGTRELRRIPHVLLLPFLRRKLNRILETTSVTPGQLEEEEEETEQ